MARGASPSERELLGIADAVLEVLEAAHARGVVHRDIKPENLFLPQNGEVKLLDFGLARLVEVQSTTTHGVALGTPSYMSPEQAAGRVDEIDGRTDVFALAASCFRVLSGRSVHEGVGPVDRVMKMANVPAPKLRDVAPHVSPEVARVIDKALEFRRDDRYASATVMRADVRKAIDEMDAAEEKTLAEERAKALPIVQEARPPAKPKRSIVPMVTAIVIGAIGGKVVYDIVAGRRAPSPSPVGSAQPVVAVGAGVTAPDAVLDAAVAPPVADDLDAGVQSAAADDAADIAMLSDAADFDDADDDTDASSDDTGDASLDAASTDAAADAAPRPATKPHAHPPRPHGPRPPRRHH
jgi:hypothetical protein